MSVVYVVYGERGEYSDHTTWPVVVVSTEESARDYVARAEAKRLEILDEIKQLRKGLPVHNARAQWAQERRKHVYHSISQLWQNNPMDPGMIGPDGYDYYEVPFVED